MTYGALRVRTQNPLSTFFLYLLITGFAPIVIAVESPGANVVYQKAIEHSSRSEESRTRDKSRKPELILPFTQIKSGDSVLELGAGGGYTTELLAHTVGENGKVLAQGLSSKSIASLKAVRPLRKHLLYELSDVLAESSVKKGQLDAAIIFFALHDFYLSERIDKQLVLQTIHQWLKPDGVLIILDNAADKNAGNAVNRRLHRIGENFVISELAKAGFRVDSTSDALRNPNDNHTRPWSAFNGMHDRFAIRFKKQ